MLSSNAANKIKIYINIFIIMLLLAIFPFDLSYRIFLKITAIS